MDDISMVQQPTHALTKCRECVLEDRISAFPDDILISIISRLELREAARTSVLSHRWRFIWTLTNGVLDFVRSVSLETTRQNNLLLNERCRFVEWVNLVLRLHKAPTIEGFRVSINIGVGNSEVVDTWIKFALERHAKSLILELGRYITFSPTYPKYSLGAHVFSNCNNSSSLTTLHLESLEVTGEVLGYMLESCFPLLQVLRLYDIYSLVELKIVGPSPSLKCLMIKDCYKMRYLEVYAVNLVSFAYRGPEITKLFKQVPSLVEADVDQAFLVKNIRQFSSCFSRLESLSLYLSGLSPQLEQMVLDIPKLPRFNKLSCLYLSMGPFSVKCCLSHCSKLLKASPALQRFVIRVSTCGRIKSDIELRSRKTIYQHTQLKVIEFISFRGCGDHADLAHRLLVKLPSLEKMVIHPQRTPKPPFFEQPRKAIETAQMLQNSYFPAVELVIASEAETKTIHI